MEYFQVTDDVGSVQDYDDFSRNSVGRSSAKSIQSNPSELSSITISSEDSGISFDSNLKYKFRYEFVLFTFFFSLIKCRTNGLRRSIKKKISENVTKIQRIRNTLELIDAFYWQINCWFQKHQLESCLKYTHTREACHELNTLRMQWLLRLCAVTSPSILYLSS